MTLGFSLFAIAVGAILKFAVTAQVAGIAIGIVALWGRIRGVAFPKFEPPAATAAGPPPPPPSSGSAT